jgi:hypothetical protein
MFRILGAAAVHDALAPDSPARADNGWLDSKSAQYALRVRKVDDVSTAIAMRHRAMLT